LKYREKRQKDKYRERPWEEVAPTWNVTSPKDDADYFDRLSKSIFTAGLNWKMVDNKWPNFRKAFMGFEPSKVAKLTERDVARLMKDDGIVRNEKKIRATIFNASRIVQLAKKEGSFEGYLRSFGKNEAELQNSLLEEFKHVGPSTARTFLWSVGYKLTPTAEEKEWMASHGHGHDA
jgi:3-methyladenine DNA glycosylase Tag